MILWVRKCECLTFLHHIGEAIERDITPAQLYKEIVEGFGEVLGADGGAIYLLKRGSGSSRAEIHLS